MKKFKRFGEMLKYFRCEKELSLREFCRMSFEDAANLSRIERSLRPAPNDDVVERYAKALKINAKSRQWTDFFDLAAISRRELPKDISDEALAMKLPALLRTLRGEKPNEQDIENAADITRKVFKP